MFATKMVHVCYVVFVGKNGKVSQVLALQQILVNQVRGGMVAKKWRQADLARKAGVTPKHLSQMLSGQVQGRLETWERLLAATR